MRLDGLIQINIELQFAEVFDRDELVRRFLEELNRVFVSAQAIDAPPKPQAQGEVATVETCFLKDTPGDLTRRAVMALASIEAGTLPEIIERMRANAPHTAPARASTVGPVLMQYYERLVGSGISPAFYPKYRGKARPRGAVQYWTCRNRSY